ncbi:hypothetical protein RRG08_060495 [Elysia crispata]|uniref:Uncharacterized protein n=1 Tax=Elysia crispata TaxID=231223 RepID=A0AAE1B1G8_9GAST|nr:hypothetical protein RRG08_060495 [Elysia crispata]
MLNLPHRGKFIKMVGLHEKVSWFSSLADPPTTLGIGSFVDMSCFLKIASSVLSRMKDVLFVTRLNIFRGNTPSYSSPSMISTLACNKVGSTRFSGH